MICHALYLQHFKGLLLQVEWAEIWLAEWVIPCAPSEVPAEVEVVLGWHLGTAVHKPFPYGCFQLSITSLNELIHGAASLALVSHTCAKISEHSEVALKFVMFAMMHPHRA